MCKDCGCGDVNSLRATLVVDGMTCNHCKSSVEGALLQLPGVMAADANVETHKVVVDFDGDKVQVEAMKTAITGIGFDVAPDVQIEAIRHHHAHGISGVISRFFGKK